MKHISLLKTQKRSTPALYSMERQRTHRTASFTYYHQCTKEPYIAIPFYYWTLFLLCFNKPRYDLIISLKQTKSLLSSHKSPLHCYWILWDVFGLFRSIILYQNSFIFLCFKNINSSFSVTKIIKFYAVTNVWIENLSLKQKRLKEKVNLCNWCCH